MTRYDNHNHTRYSNLRLRDALATPEQLIDKAIELGLSGISISDHETVSGHVKANKYYFEKIKDEHPDFKIGLSNEIYLVDERPSDNHYHYVLTPIDEIGYHQIRELSTLAWLYSYEKKGLRVDTLKSDLETIVMREPGHLIGSSACIGGELGKCILGLTDAEKIGDKATAEKYHSQIVNFILWNKKVFGDNFYLEVQPGISKEQQIVNRRILSIANCFDLKMIPTSDTHYLRPEDRYVHKAFLNSEDSEKKGQREVDAFYQDAFLHTNEEMIEKFAVSGFDKLFVEKMFENSMEIYDKITVFNLHHSQQIPHIEVPVFPKQAPPAELEKYPTLSSMYMSEDSINRYWINTCINKLKEINKFNEIYLNELEEEAEVKKIVGDRLNTNMYAYPICLAHYIDMIWESGSSVGVGRGSACSALNHYLLGITQLDPVEWDFPFFRYMNRDTDGLGDIDIDVCPSKVQTIIENIRKERGQKFNSSITDPYVRNLLGATYVCTFGSESSKSAILTAARGYRSEDYPEGIDNDIAQYLSSLVPVERGFTWSISDVYYGNPDKGRKAIDVFKNEIDSYPGLLEIILGIEGCISRRGRHASGVLFNNEDPFEFNAYMVTPGGEIVSQYDLHDAEWCGAVKMDILVTEVQDKAVQTLKFLQEYGEVEAGLSIREIYNKYLHPDVLPYKTDLDTWHNIQEASTLDLFQLDSDIGRQGAKKVRPTNMIELSSTNALIRLMNTEKGAEAWIDKFVRYKNNENEYKRDIEKYHLTEKENTILNKYVGNTCGIGLSQEQFMRVVMDPEICDFSLKEANKGRKVISKKKIKEIPALKEEVFSKAKNLNLANYVWDYIVAPGLGYSFSDIHSLSYSFIGFQTAYLATHWNPIYWDTACLVVNSGSLEETQTEVVDIYEKEDFEEYNYTDLPNRQGKKKEKTVDYSKNAIALNKIINQNVDVSLININESSFGFLPNTKENNILYGLKALSGVNSEIINKIIENRPYKGIKDFMNKCPLIKRPMVNLIKAGAFDNVEKDLSSRVEIMAYYISKICKLKSNLNLQNWNSLVQNGLIPIEELGMSIRAFNFNKYIKVISKQYQEYYIDDAGLQFFQKFIPELIDEIEFTDSNMRFLNRKIWDKKYQKLMDPARDWLKEHQEEVLRKYNNILFKETWEKYASGNTSHWEMEAIGFYHGEHELKRINSELYDLSNFNDLISNDVDYYIKRKGVQFPIYKLYRIIGTVISKNDTRSSINLLVPNGDIVNVKFSKEQYAKYKRQISEIQADGTKKVIEKGWFSRGTKLMVTGYKRDDQFVVKTYSSTPTHQVYLIEEVLGQAMKLRHERIQVNNAIEEDDIE